MGLTGVNSVSVRQRSFLEDLGGICSLAHSGCRQNSVPCVCKTEVPISLLSIRWGLFQASRYCPHSLACDSFSPSSKFQWWVESVSCLKSFLPLLPSYHSLLSYLRWHAFKDPCYYLWPLQIIEFNLPISRSVPLAPSAKILLPFNKTVTVSRDQGVNIFGDLILPTTGYFTLKLF